MASTTERIRHSLDLDEDIRLAEKSYPIQRAGWAILALFIIAASLGTCGTGLLSKTSQQQENASLEYERFGRYKNPFELNFELHQINQHAVIAIPQSYLKDMEITSILPEPSQQAIEDGRNLYLFNGTGSMRISFFLEPQKAGKHTTTLMAGHNRFTISQLIYP